MYAAAQSHCAPKRCKLTRCNLTNGSVGAQEEQTNGTHLVLQNVTYRVTGKYSCEVSMETPSFQTGMQSAEMEVVGKCPDRALPLSLSLSSSFS